MAAAATGWVATDDMGSAKLGFLVAGRFLEEHRFLESSPFFCERGELALFWGTHTITHLYTKTHIVLLGPHTEFLWGTPLITSQARDARKNPTVNTVSKKLRGALSSS